MFGFDEELPRGFQDADFEMRELEEAARRDEQLRAKGICTHGFVQGPPGPVDKPTKIWTCLHCGATFDREEDLRAAQNEHR